MRLFEKVDNDYITFPTTLKTYKWFKPIVIIAVAFLLMYLVFPTVLSGIFSVFIPDFLSMVGSALDQPYTIVGMANLVITAFITLAVYIPTRFIVNVIDCWLLHFISCSCTWRWLPEHLFLFSISCVILYIFHCSFCDWW